MWGSREDAAGVGRRGPRMRYKVGAEQVEQIPSLAHRPDGVFRSARTAPVGPTHAVDAAKCPGCFAAVVAHGEA